MAWWLWSAWVVEPGGEARPFYSFTAQSGAAEQPRSDEIIKLPSGATLRIADAVYSDSAIQTLTSSLRGSVAELDLSSYFADAPKIPISYARRVITRAFGQDAVQSLTKYGMPDPESLFGSPQDVPPLLDTCSSRLGLQFRSEFSAHLGGFDLFEMGHWFESSAPYGMQVLKEVPQPQSDGVRVWRTVTTEDEVAHLILHCDGEVVLDQIATLQQGEAHADIEIATILDSMDLRVFQAASGRLVYRQSNHFIREIGMNIATLGRTLQHADSLSRKAAGSKEVATRATATTSMNSSRSMIGLDPTSLRAFRKKMTTFLDRTLPTESADRWFDRGVGGEFGAIDYLNNLLDTSASREAVLVDPFFGIDALERVLLRIRQSGLKITVIASWGRNGPETQTPPADGRDLAEEARLQLMRALTAAGPHIAPRFQFLNLVTNSGEQAFHDRYFLLEEDSGPARVFLLSNSLNGMAVNWPFCISELEGNARHKAASYIRGLIDGRDISGSTNPKVSFRWPEQREPSAVA